MTPVDIAVVPPRPVSFAEAARIWARIGWLSFGGPAGQIAQMHQELVEKRRWISEPRFLHALNYCMLLPRPEAQQLAVYIGWLMHRTAGGLVAGVLFVLPGCLTMLLLSVLYATLGHVPLVNALFFGLKAAVLAVVVEAVLRIGRRALKKSGDDRNCWCCVPRDFRIPRPVSADHFRRGGDRDGRPPTRAAGIPRAGR
ncbi:chromate transporter [Tahibacter sp.]|jgi:chromate transporter|uniref:chromate transporter n=1 Tax=Tahibacter sp. TaxID=2056211 RepID=UPI0028C3E72A|nr:chromate transporter [Tahibacter sp.]